MKRLSLSSLAVLSRLSLSVPDLADTPETTGAATVTTEPVCQDQEVRTQATVLVPAAPLSPREVHRRCPLGSPQWRIAGSAGNEIRLPCESLQWHGAAAKRLFRLTRPSRDRGVVSRRHTHEIARAWSRRTRRTGARFGGPFVFPLG